MHSDKASLALGLGIMALAAWAAISAAAWPLKTALFPLVIAIPVFCLASAEVLWVLFGSKPPAQKKELRRPAEAPAPSALLKIAIAVGWIIGFFAAIVLLGFQLAVPLFVFAYLKLQAREGWIFSSLFTLAVWAVFYGLFDRLLHLPFAAGWLLSW